MKMDRTMKNVEEKSKVKEGKLGAQLEEILNRGLPEQRYFFVAVEDREIEDLATGKPKGVNVAVVKDTKEDQLYIVNPNAKPDSYHDILIRYDKFKG